MKRIPEHNSPNQVQNPQLESGFDEFEGLVGMGMKGDALRLARQKLKSSTLTAKEFNGALNAILTLADNLKQFSSVVKSSYAHLPKRDLPAVRFMMMSFHSGLSDNEALLQLLPRRFSGEFNLLELAFGVSAALALDRMKLAKKLARQLPRAIEQADNPMMRSHLLLCLAEYFARTGKWDEAIAVWEVVQNDETFSRNAIVGIGEKHVARALQVIQRGLELMEKFNGNFDPQSETIMPGNDKVIQQQAETQFRQLQKTLEKILSKERLKELGLKSSNQT